MPQIIAIIFCLEIILCMIPGKIIYFHTCVFCSDNTPSNVKQNKYIQSDIFNSFS